MIHRVSFYRQLVLAKRDARTMRSSARHPFRRKAFTKALELYEFYPGACVLYAHPPIGPIGLECNVRSVAHRFHLCGNRGGVGVQLHIQGGALLCGCGRNGRGGPPRLRKSSRHWKSADHRRKIVCVLGFTYPRGRCGRPGLALAQQTDLEVITSCVGGAGLAYSLDSINSVANASADIWEFMLSGLVACIVGVLVQRHLRLHGCKNRRHVKPLATQCQIRMYSTRLFRRQSS